MTYPFPSSIKCYWGEISLFCQWPSAVRQHCCSCSCDTLATNVPTNPSRYSPRICSGVHSCEVDTESVGSSTGCALCYCMKGDVHSTFWDGACCLGIVGYFFSRLWCLQKPCEIKVGIWQKVIDSLKCPWCYYLCCLGNAAFIWLGSICYF